MEKIEADLSQIEDADEKRLLQIRIATLYDKVAEAARETRTCPGPYWREGSEQIRPKRRRQQGCSNQFTKLYIGPPPPQNQHQQVLCDACGQLWSRDRKKKAK